MDVDPMIRDFGYYAVIEGRECYCSVLGADYVQVPTLTGIVRHDLADVERVIQVSTRATWRGARISVTGAFDQGARFYTNDQSLAEAEGLRGDFHTGWQGFAPVSELTDVSERISVVHPRGDPVVSVWARLLVPVWAPGPDDLTVALITT